MTGRPRGSKGMTDKQLDRRKEKMIKHLKSLSEEETEN